MNPIRICLEDFMSHSFSDIDCTGFKSALIVGKNRQNDRESNGTGKTTLFSAIEYVLFNVAPTKTLDKIIRDDCNKCKVIFEFETLSGVYRITRSRTAGGKSDVKLERKQQQDWVNISQRTSAETEKDIQKIVKISHKAFTHSVLFAQGDLSGLASATPEKRRAILKEPLNLSLYTKYEAIAKKQAAEIVTELEKQRAVSEVLGDPESDIEVSKKQREMADEEINKKNSELDEIKKRVRVDQGSIVKLEKGISSEAMQVTEKLSQTLQNKQDVSNDLAQLERSMGKNKDEHRGLKQALELNTSELRGYVDSLEELHAQRCRKEEDVRAELEKTARNELNGVAVVSKLEAKYDELSTFLLPDNEMCPYCQQEITEEHRTDCREKLAADLEKIILDLAAAKPKLEKVKTLKKKLEHELKNIAANAAATAALESKIESKKDGIKTTQAMIARFEEIITKEGLAAANKSEQIIKLAAEGTVLAEQVARFQVGSVNDQINAIKEHIKKLESTAASLTNDISSLNLTKGSLEEKIKTRTEDKKKLAAIKSSIVEMEGRLDDCVRVVQAFSSTGIPSLIIHTILDDLQIEANNLLSELRPGLELQFYIEKEKANGEAADTLDIIYRVNGVERDYLQLSGGQKLLVALSLKLGLSLVIQSRLGVDIKFLELDEVDQPLDKAGVDAFADVIRRWREKFKVFVITHNDLLKNKFSHAIVVESDGKNGSTAQVLTSW